MHHFRLIFRAGVALAAASASVAAQPIDPVIRQGLMGMIAEDGRVARIGYRLLLTAAPLCRLRGFQSGMVLHAADQYGMQLRPTARNVFVLDTHLVISAIVSGGAAEAAGLAVGDKLLTSDGEPLPVIADPAPRSGSFTTVDRGWRQLDSAFADGEVALDVDRNGKRLAIRLRGAPGCAAHVQLLPSPTINAYSDDRYATITTALARLTPTDDELAIVLAHEVAHTILQHEALLAARGRRNAAASLVLATERQADAVGLYLAAKAGFDIGAASGIWARLSRARGPALVLRRTHPPYRDRDELLAETAQRARAGVLPLPDLTPPNGR